MRNSCCKPCYSRKQYIANIRSTVELTYKEPQPTTNICHLCKKFLINSFQIELAGISNIYTNFLYTRVPYIRVPLYTPKNQKLPIPQLAALTWTSFQELASLSKCSNKSRLPERPASSTLRSLFPKSRRNSKSKRTIVTAAVT